MQSIIGPSKSIEHRCLAYCYTHCQIQDNAYIEMPDGPPVNQAQMLCILLQPLLYLGQCIYIEGRWTPSQLSTDALHIVRPTARSRTMHIQRCQMDPQSIKHRCFAYCYTNCYIQDNAYIQKEDGPPSQLSIDALHTATPTAISRTMHVYRMQMNPQSSKHICIEYCCTKYISIAQCYPAQVLPSQLSTDALHTATPTAGSRTMHTYRRQMNPQSFKHRCLACHYTHCQISENAYIQKTDGIPSHLCTDVLPTVTPTTRSRTMHVYRRQMNPQSIKHRCLAYCYTHCQIQNNAYIQKADGPPSQSSIDALNTTTFHVALPSQLSTDVLHTVTPTTRSRIIHIYRRQMNPLSFEHRCLAYCYTHYQIQNNACIQKADEPPVNQAQMLSILLHSLLDLEQCIYIEGRWTTQSIKHRCIEYHYISCGPPQSIEHRCLAYCYTHYQIQNNSYIQKAYGPLSQFRRDSLNTITLHVALLSQSSTDAQHTTTLKARSRTIHIYKEGRWPPQSIKHR